MDIEIKVYCEYCNVLVEFDIFENQTIYDEYFKIEFLGSKCKCKICDHEVFSDTIQLINMDTARKVYESKLISIDQITKLLKKHNIDEIDLAKKLGWDKYTIRRYLNGSLPSNRHSEKLLSLLND